MLLMLSHLLSESLHKHHFLRLLRLAQLLLRRYDQLLRVCLFLACRFRLSVEVTVYERKDEILVIVEGFDITVEFEEMGGHFVLKIVELHQLSHLLAQLGKLSLCSQ